MAEISISTGLVRLEVNRDGERVGAIAFNPNDVRFVEAYYRLYQSCDEKITRYQQRLEALEEGDYEGRFAAIHEVVAELEQDIDSVFGEGTSRVAFGDAETMDMFYDFFAAVIPFISESRKKQAQRYLSADSDTLE